MSETLARRVMLGCALIGTAIAAYLTFVHARGETPLCAAGGGGCHTVALSPYAELAGVPVAAYGLAGYLLLAGCALLRGDLGRFAGWGFALAGLCFSGYLTYLELFVIDAICQWCVASAVVMTAVFACACLRLRATFTMETSP